MADPAKTQAARQSRCTAEESIAGPVHPIAQALLQSVNYAQECRDQRRSHVHALRQHSNEEVVQKRIAMLEEPKLRWFCRVVWAPKRARCSRCSDRAIISSPGMDIRRNKAALHRRFVTMGIEVSCVDPDERRVWRSSIRRNTRAIFVESPVNPTSRVLDIAQIATMARHRVSHWSWTPHLPARSTRARSRKALTSSFIPPRSISTATTIFFAALSRVPRRTSTKFGRR